MSHRMDACSSPTGNTTMPTFVKKNMSKASIPANAWPMPEASTFVDVPIRVIARSGV